MKYTSKVIAALSFSGLSLAVALDKRQDIDFAAYDAVPVLPDIAPPVGDAVPVASSYAPSQVASAAAAAVTKAAVVKLGSGSAAVVNVKRDFPIARRAACSPRTAGSGPVVNNPDTAEAFQAYPQFANDANSATIPVGYQRIVTNSLASAQDSTYMTYTLLTSYNTAGCAAYCQAHKGCNSFNLFYERDAIVDPGVGCENPPSLTYIKCSIFGGLLNTASAKSVGQSQFNFQVVIAGSDIYVATTPATPPTFQGPYNYGNATIQSPSGYMGVQTFPQSQPYDPSICASACDRKSAFDIQQGLPTKANPDICNFFVAYVLYKNGENGVFTCTYYTSYWDNSYATNVGQYDGKGNHFTIGYSNGFSKDGAPRNGVFTTTTSTTSTATPTPTCQPASLLSDTKNCGRCGNVCPSGASCMNGACSSPTCGREAQCASRFDCNASGTCACYMEVSKPSVQFCADTSGVSCGSSTLCTKSSDCSTGSVCLISCCPSGQCFDTRTCGNPANTKRMFGAIGRDVAKRGSPSPMDADYTGNARRGTVSPMDT